MCVPLANVITLNVSRGRMASIALAMTSLDFSIGYPRIEPEISITKINSRGGTSATSTRSGGCRISIYVAVDNDEQRAEGRLKEWFGRRYGNADMASQVAVWGSTAKVTEELAKVTDAGAEMVLLNPAFDDLEHLEILAQEVIPNL